MTWHCPRWTEEISRDSIAEDGTSINYLYGQYRCNDFWGTISINVDYLDQTQNTGETEEVTCGIHDRAAHWNDDPNLGSELDDESIPWCEDCELAFPNQEDLDRHNNELHGIDQALSAPQTTHQTWQ